MASRRIFLMLAVLAAALIVPGTAEAQDAIDRVVGRPVTSITFEIEGRAVRSDDLESLVPIRPGDPLRLDAVMDGERHLVNAGRYDSVEIAFTEHPGGIDLIVRLTPRHPLDQVQFRGDTGLSARELERLLRDRFGGLPAREQPQAVAQVMAGLLRDEGFWDAQIEQQVELTHNPDRAALILTVSAGLRRIIARTEIAGKSPYTREQIQARTNTAPGQPFRRADLERRLATIEDDLRKAGYLTAVALLPSDPVTSEGGLVVALLVEAGPKVSLEWDGPQPEGDPENFVPLRRQRSVDEDLLEDSDERVMTYWRRLGFKDVQVSHTRATAGEQLTITMHTSRGRKRVVQDVRITGSAMPEPQLRQTLNIHPGEPYDVERLEAGITGLIGIYRQQGYHRVVIPAPDVQDVTASQTATVVPVVISVDVREGPRAQVGVVTLPGADASRQTALRRLLASTAGAPFVAASVVRDVSVIDAYYRNLGFGVVEVSVQTEPGADASTIDIAFTINEGPQITVGTIRVVGNRAVSEAAIKDVMTLKEGQPLGAAARTDSSRRISQMGIFQSVTIEEEPRPSGDTVANVVVIVEELPANSVLFGGGLEGGRVATETSSGAVEDRTFISPRGSFEYSRRNLFGRNRAIDFFVRAAPRPTTRVTENFGFLEYRASTTYHEPRAFSSETDVTISLASEQAARTGFNFLRQSATLQVIRRLSPEVIGSARYGLEYTHLFDVNKEIIAPENEFVFERLFEQVRLSTFSTAVIWDRRDDLLDPSRGTMMSVEGELAGRRIGSQVGYGKIFLQGMAFHALPTARRIVLAGRAQVGVAKGFPRTELDHSTGVTVTNESLPVSTRFFAGGSTTVRGFQLDRLAVPELLTGNGLSPGGNGMVILNAEVRARVARLLGRDFVVAGFTDAGNVFPKASDIDLTRLRCAVGFGLRYNSVLGPIRVDLGFKTDRQVIAGKRERGWEYHINIGEAF